jgi:putative endonuclease
MVVMTMRLAQFFVMLNLFQHPWWSRIENVKDPCTYILASQPRGTLYIGATSNIMQRMHQHRNKVFSGFSSRYTVFRLVRFELFGTMHDAIAREKQLKRWHRPWKINLIESENPHWIDLAMAWGFDPVPPRTA